MGETRKLITLEIHPKRPGGVAEAGDGTGVTQTRISMSGHGSNPTLE